MEHVPELEQTPRPLQVRQPPRRAWRARRRSVTAAWTSVEVHAGGAQVAAHAAPTARRTRSSPKNRSSNPGGRPAGALDRPVERLERRRGGCRQGRHRQRRARASPSSRLDLVARQFDAPDGLRDADVEIAADKPRRPDRHHQPVAHRDQAVELERRYGGSPAPARRCRRRCALRATRRRSRSGPADATACAPRTAACRPSPRAGHAKRQADACPTGAAAGAPPCTPAARAASGSTSHPPSNAENDRRPPRRQNDAGDHQHRSTVRAGACRASGQASSTQSAVGPRHARQDEAGGAVVGIEHVGPAVGLAGRAAACGTTGTRPSGRTTMMATPAASAASSSVLDAGQSNRQAAGREVDVTARSRGSRSAGGRRNATASALVAASRRPRPSRTSRTGSGLAARRSTRAVRRVAESWPPARRGRRWSAPGASRYWRTIAASIRPVRQSRGSGRPA